MLLRMLKLNFGTFGAEAGTGNGVGSPAIENFTKKFNELGSTIERLTEYMYATRSAATASHTQFRHTSFPKNVQYCLYVPPC